MTADQSKESIFEFEYSSDSVRRFEAHGFYFSVTPRFEYHYINSRGFEKVTVALFEAMLNRHSRVIDIGAHYGYYSVVAASIAREGTVIACEPVPFNRNILRINIRDNELSNVIIDLGIAISSETGIREFNIAEASDNSGFGEHPNTRVLEKINVQTLTLDELTCKYGVKPDIIKIDAEGHENEILDGAVRTLVRDGLILVIEFNPKCLVAAGHAPERILRRLMEQRFHIRFVNDETGVITRVARPRDWEGLMGPREYRNFFALSGGQLPVFERICRSLKLPIKGNGILTRLLGR